MADVTIFPKHQQPPIANTDKTILGGGKPTRVAGVPPRPAPPAPAPEPEPEAVVEEAPPAPPEDENDSPPEGENASTPDGESGENPASSDIGNADTEIIETAISRETPPTE